MRRSLAATAAIIALAGTAFAGVALAEDEPALVDYSALRPSLAVELAQATLASCREAGYQITVAVVDRFGLPQVVLRDQYAGSHTIDTAIGKARTAASFHSGTLELERSISDGSLGEALREIPGAVILGGGLPIQSAGSLVGGIGVSGAPGGDLDEACAQDGLDTISDRLMGF